MPKKACSTSHEIFDELSKLVIPKMRQGEAVVKTSERIDWRATYFKRMNLPKRECVEEDFGYRTILGTILVSLRMTKVWNVNLASEEAEKSRVFPLDCDESRYENFGRCCRHSKAEAFERVCYWCSGIPGMSAKESTIHTEEQ